MTAQAKVNLRLRVLAREMTRFHQIETLFLRLALGDEVRLRLTTGDRRLAVTGVTDAGALGPVEKNLAWRAAEAFFAATGQTGGFAIELEKRIPIGGGLGGGSADAAAVLRILSAIAPASLPDTALLEIAAGLGADVAFLASGHAFALGWGRGERLLGLPAPSARDVLLLVPEFGVNTAAAYGWLADAGVPGSGARGGSGVLVPEELSRWETLTSLAENDFEAVVGARHPEVPRMVKALRAAGCAPAMMSGSGSVVFGVLQEGADASRARDAVARDTGDASVIVTRTATRVEPVLRLE